MSRRIPFGSSFGVMQGRLSRQTSLGYQAFPASTWRSEFALAAERGLEHIEWIVDRHASWDNPLVHRPETILGAIKQSGVLVVSVCADIFMDQPLDRDDEASFGLLSAILGSMKHVGARHLVLPCVDQSSLLHSGNLSRLQSALPRLVSLAAESDVIVALESDLPPADLAYLLTAYESPHLGVNYDSGNSASLGYSWAAERDSYGSRITLVHIKDRQLGGQSVPLGTGSADLEGLFEWLGQGFAGPVTMQAFRDKEGLTSLDEQIQWVAQRAGAPTCP